jgi:release factor glutamine methyltransferase
MSHPGAERFTVRELLGAARAELAPAGSAQLDAEVLLCAVLGVERSYCFAYPEAPVTAAAAADFRRLVARRAEGVPLAYLTGRREFWSLDLEVDRHTLIPRPETELLVELVLALLAHRAAPELLELGAGSGAVGLAIARERPDARVTATDVCRHALAVAAHNARRLGIGNVAFLHSDWYTAVGPRRFTAIVSNPPYVDERDAALRQPPLRHEPRLALDGGPGGLAALARIVAGAGRHLRPDGRIVLEHGADQGGRVRALLAAAGFTDVETHRDAAGLERASTGRWP